VKLGELSPLPASPRPPRSPLRSPLAHGILTPELVNLPVLFTGLLGPSNCAGQLLSALFVKSRAPSRKEHFYGTWLGPAYAAAGAVLVSAPV
jgi:hypothetical protein